MTREATCFRCRHVLLVSPDAQERWLTCPRCLASVGNPNVLLPAEPPSAAETPAHAPPALPAPPTPTNCPWCGRPIDSDWRFCPFCEKPLRATRPRTGRASVDVEATGDRGVGGVAALILGGLLMAGAVLFLVIGGPSLVQQTSDPGQVFFVGALAVGAFLVGAVVLAFGARTKAVGVVSGVLGGVAVGAGVVLLVVLVACMTIMAAVANFLHTCGCK